MQQQTTLKNVSHVIIDFGGDCATERFDKLSDAANACADRISKGLKALGRDPEVGFVIGDSFTESVRQDGACSDATGTCLFGVTFETNGMIREVAFHADDCGEDYAFPLDGDRSLQSKANGVVRYVFDAT